MNRNPIFLFFLPLIIVSFSPLAAQDTNAPPLPPAEETNPGGEEKDSAYNETEFGRAVSLSQSISTTTGVSISPLLGMGALGAWQYFRTDDALRDNLPWYTSPWVWGICFGIFLLLKSTDTVGAWIPELVKKPVTVLDNLQDKASALIVALAVIPTAVLNDFRGMAPPQSSTSDSSAAMAPIVFPILIVVLSVAIFAVVWIAFHALSSIKVLSPSSLINAAISIVKGAFLAAFAFFAALNPWVGLVLSLVIILVCALFFGWAFRWNVFGVLFIKDFFTAAYNRSLKADEKLKGFSKSGFPGVKTRTYGELQRRDDALYFLWKPWLIFPRKSCRIPLSQAEGRVREGIFLPSITVKTPEMERSSAVFDFRLRYRSQTEAIEERLQLDGSEPCPVLSGIRSCWLWVTEQFRQGGGALAKAWDNTDSALAKW